LNFTLGDLAARYGCDLLGDPNIEITHFSTLELGQTGSISFLSNRSYINKLKKTKASAVIIRSNDIDDCNVGAIITDDPYLLYSKIVELLHPLEVISPGISESAAIEKNSNISDTSYIGPLVSIGSNVKINENVYIGPGCVIHGDIEIARDSRLYANITLINSVKIGERTQIHPGVVIGGDGFGNVKTHNGWKKINQIGGVIVGDDVEIGSNTTIDRGSIENTVIKNGVRLDNLIQIGHNTQIGEHTAIASSVAIAGSVKIGKNCMIAGQVGIVGHIDICDDVRINGAAVVTKDIKKPGIYSGSIPLEDDKKWKKLVAKFKRSLKN
tara:strand:- start:2553 stop:3530 length:978 start_codon:yes stop_codon:yes gene_type:complete